MIFQICVHTSPLAFLKVSTTLGYDLPEQLRRLAEEDDRSLSQYINLILKKYLEEKSK